MVIKDGKIVLEKYFDSFTKDSIWFWASAGKSLTSVLVGIAQEEGLLDISEPTNMYLGDGWTSATPSQESAITIRNQLTMTSGLDDGIDDHFCTDPECLIYLEDSGERWSYHNGSYTLLDEVIENASGVTLNAYSNLKIEAQTGMTGAFIPLGFNNIYFSKSRDMARFGLLNLNKGL